ncbi:hypothetical protein DAPPUDRAFT_110675 [Daphnia pulex]|uniref:Uncharacterized protein n=1 Tax=Daphnia pulex TaxID=6669 RepID=E9H6Z7_DAPPU|nr:hypothetical protein DAPPUDRAFT_110675 [Daphnia pulex]|eukprot:EFX72526.1 hypothetical protein DAPPUDRAFT_110675 [Daphnia pulex]
MSENIQVVEEGTTYEALFEAVAVGQVEVVAIEEEDVFTKEQLEDVSHPAKQPNIVRNVLSECQSLILATQETAFFALDALLLAVDSLFLTDIKRCSSNQAQRLENRRLYYFCVCVLLEVKQLLDSVIESERLVGEIGAMWDMRL